MKKVLLGLLTVILVIGIAVTGCAKPAPAPAPAPGSAPVPAPAPVKPIELKLATSSAITTGSTQTVLLPWIKEIETRTGGRVKVTVYYAETLGKSSEQYNMVLTGLCDMALITVSGIPGKFPLSDVFELPYTVPYVGFLDPAVDKTGKPVQDTVVEKYLIPGEYSESKVLWFTRYPPGLLLMMTKEIRTLEDAKGLVIGSPGGKTAPKILQAWGAAPETVLPTEMYTALERKMVAGTLCGPKVIESFKLIDLLKSITMTNVGSALQFCAMNLNTWNSLPPDIQKVFDELWPFYKALNDKDDKATVDHTWAACKQKGIELIELSPEEMQRFTQAAAGCESEWAAEMDAKGLPGTKLVNEIHQLLSK